MPIDFLTTINQGENRIMNHTLRNLTGAILAISALFVQDTRAGLATPAGIFTVSLATGNNFIATPFARSEEGVGSISSQAGSVLTVSPTSGPLSYPTNAYGSSAEEPYIFEILDGTWIGFSAPILSNTANTITLPAGAPTGLSGSKYVIRKDWTVESIFGDAASSSLTATNLDDGDDISSADQIRLMNDSGVLGPVYYRGFRNGSYGWFKENGDSAAKVRLPFGKGIFVKCINPKSLVLSGDLRGARTRMDIVGGKKINLLGNPVPFAVKLSESGMDIAPGSGPGTADNLRIWNGTSWTTFWRNTTGRWTVGSSGDASEQTIPAGAGFLIKRNSNRGDLKGVNALKFTASAVSFPNPTNNIP
jgi:hypothetical protein